MVKVYNKRNRDAPHDAVYVGRPGKWGNPFKIHPHRRGGEFARRISILAYIEYLDQNPKLAELARQELRGKDLVCWCAPLHCHADILLEVANAD